MLGQQVPSRPSQALTHKATNLSELHLTLLELPRVCGSHLERFGPFGDSSGSIKAYFAPNISHVYISGGQSLQRIDKRWCRD